MNNKTVLYKLNPFDPAGHRVRVQMTIPDPDPAGQRLALPAWIPGSYLMRDFARHIESVTAWSQNCRVPLRKVDQHTWLCDVVAGVLHVEYVVYAWDLSVRGAHFDESHAFFNGTSVFLAALDRLDAPCLVELEAPARAPDWQVHTSLPGAAANNGGFGWYHAPDYDALIDHPVEMGTPTVATFQVYGAEHRLVLTGQVPNVDTARIVRDIQRICTAQVDLFSPDAPEAPFLDSADAYVFLVTVTGNDYGGLEHRSSTALMTARADLPVCGNPEQSAGYRRFLGLVSHEYFHTWHVKRIKPAAFVPYDLWRENTTRLLWVFEGFTSYYDDLMLLRSGVITRDTYFQLLAETISSVYRAPGRHKQSVADSSFDAWTRFYKQDENSPNALVSYYTKGALVALGLDIFIRHRTRNRRCLDDVMRLLWQRYGRGFYRGQARGVPEDGMADLICAATGLGRTVLKPFLQDYVAGCADIPLHTLLAGQGVSLTWENTGARVSLDVRSGATTGGVLLSTVLAGGAAHAAGLSAGDVLIAVNGLRVQSPQDLAQVLQAYCPGDRVTVHVFRRDELRSYQVALAVPPKERAVLCVLDETAEPILRKTHIVH